jgi:hypothetical protein
LAARKFEEVLLGPLQNDPIDYHDVIDVAGLGQLRFNTEPEIWSASSSTDRFYSISPLFRKETEVNPLRRSAFFVVDFYQPGSPKSVLPIFTSILDELSRAGLTAGLSRLRFDEAQYDPMIDGPRTTESHTRWVVTTGYDPQHSFYEVDRNGISTRQEIFLVTPLGHLEVGVFGITGWNRNPDYVVRSEKGRAVSPDFGRCGMCIGLERLLLAEQVLSLTDTLTQ